MRTTKRRADRPSLRGAGAALVATFAAALLLGCGKQEKVYEVTEIRERPDAGLPAPEVPSDTRFGANRGRADDALPTGGASAWAFATPPGWEQAASGPMRDLAWRVAGSADAECTFSALPGGAGGLVANVNRWRKQMSVGPLEDEAVRALPKKTLLGRPATLVELAGVFKGMGGQKVVSGAKLLGLVVELPMATAFLKMTGPAAVVDAESASFFALAESLRMKTGGEAAPAMPPHGDSEAPPFHWTEPAGWKKQGERPMRLVSFVPDGAPHADVYVSVLGGAAGGAKANVDRWRDQMGLPALTEDEFAKLPHKTILGQEALFVSIEGTFAGMDPGKGKAGWMLLGMMVSRGDRTVFAKMTGPADEVKLERERFQAFCESFHD